MRRPGRPVFGFRSLDGRLYPEPTEMAVVKSVLACLDEGIGVDHILPHLMQEHGTFLTRRWPSPTRRWKNLGKLLRRADFYRSRLRGGRHGITNPG